MKKTILYITFLLLPYCQTLGQILTKKNFVEINPPNPATAEWYSLNNSSDKPIKVSIEKGEIKIELSKENYGDTHYQLSSGILLSKNGGEFGGGLFYKPFDKTLKRIIINGVIDSQLVEPNISGFINPKQDQKTKFDYFKLPGGNINSFFKFKDTLYYTSGLAHMGSNFGTLTKLINSGNDTFFISKVTDLEGAPMTHTIINDRIIFITYDGLIVLKGFKKLINLKKQFWASLYPNSVAYLDEKNVYIGMRGCYSIIDLTSNKIRCFKLKD